MRKEKEVENCTYYEDGSFPSASGRHRGAVEGGGVIGKFLWKVDNRVVERFVFLHGNEDI